MGCCSNSSSRLAVSTIRFNVVVAIYPPGIQLDCLCKGTLYTCPVALITQDVLTVSIAATAN